MNYPAASYGVSDVMPDPVSGTGQARSGIQFEFLDSGACPGPDPGFAGMTTRGKTSASSVESPRVIKPIEIKYV